MNIKEAARRLNISESTARRWIKTGRLQADLVDGAYGPQYEISEESIQRAKDFQNVPIVINNSMVTMEDIEKAIFKALNRGLVMQMDRIDKGYSNISDTIKRVEQSIHQEVEGLKIELEQTKKELEEERENQRRLLLERDKKLMEAIRDIQQRQKEEAERNKRPFWTKIFRRK